MRLLEEVQRDLGIAQHKLDELHDEQQAILKVGSTAHLTTEFFHLIGKLQSGDAWLVDNVASAERDVKAVIYDRDGNVYYFIRDAENT